MNELVLSLFPGIGMLDTAFELEGFCVVRGPDVLWGGDIRRFRPPAERFDGVIGGPPCQAFSRMRHVIKANGHTPKFGNLIPEFERCVLEADPDWFVMENVPDAPLPSVDGYELHSFLLNNRQLGEKQNRVRRWSFGCAGERRVLHVETQVFETIDRDPTALGGPRPGPTKTVVPGIPKRGHSDSKAAVEDLVRLQGLPAGFDLPGFTVSEKCQALGNGVPLPMGRAIAKAVRKAIDQ